MNRAKARAKATVERVPGGEATVRRVRRALDSATATGRRAWHPEVRRSNRWLSELRDSREGERCVIVGNGPSLNLIDFGLLEECTTIALNRGYLKFKEYGFEPEILVCVNPNVADQFASELEEVHATRVFSLACLPFVSRATEHIFVQSVHGPRFTDDVRRGVWEGATVTYVAMQLAFFLGFSDVILVGVDHRFADKGTPHEAVVAGGPDLNHFDPTYFGPGVVWQLPDLETSELAYGLALKAYRAAGRRIVNCTVGGDLNVFPKASLESILSQGSTGVHI